MQVVAEARDFHGDGLVAGALVRWVRRAGYGVITEVGATSICVRWDDPHAPVQFKLLNPPLLRACGTRSATGTTISSRWDGWEWI